MKGIGATRRKRGAGRASVPRKVAGPLGSPATRPRPRPEPLFDSAEARALSEHVAAAVFEVDPLDAGAPVAKLIIIRAGLLARLKREALVRDTTQQALYATAGSPEEQERIRGAQRGDSGVIADALKAWFRRIDRGEGEEQP